MTLTAAVAARPAPPAPSNRLVAQAEPRILRWTVVGLSLVATVICRLSMLAHPFHNDSGLYACLGKTVANGGVLYHDIFETKLPGAALLIAPLWPMFANHWLAYVLLQAAMSLIAAAMLGRTLGRVVGPQAGLPAGAAAAVLLNFSPIVYTGFQMETILCFFSILAACAAITVLGGASAWRSFLAGLAAGVGAMLKPTALAVIGAFFAALLWQHRTLGWRRMLAHAAAALAGVAIPTAAVFAWVVHQHLLGDMPEVFRQISLYGSQTVIPLLDWTKLSGIVALLMFPIAIRGAIFRRPRYLAPSAPAALCCFALVWLGLETLGVVMQARMYMYHFLVMVPPAAMLFGLLPRRALLMPILASLLPIVGGTIAHSAGDCVELFHGVPNLPVSDYLLAHASPGDSVWMDQMGRLLMETGLKPGSRYFLVYYFTNYDQAPLDYSRQLLADFQQRKPAYIILERDLDGHLQRQCAGLPNLALRPVRRANFMIAWAAIKSYVAENYHPEAEMDGQIIYRRNNAQK